MITLAKKNDLHARRQALGVIRSKDVVAKLFSDLRERFQDRPGGYIRIIPKGPRLGDAAPVSIIELLGRPEKIKKAKKSKSADLINLHDLIKGEEGPAPRFSFPLGSC